MGFFSDLKDDLSQAVNDLKPEETVITADELPDKEEEVKESVLDSFTDDDLSNLLDQIDSDTGFSSETKVDEVEMTEKIVEPTVSVPPTPVPVQYTEPQMSTMVASDEVSVIMTSMIINGNMSTEGSLELRGEVVGNVECLGKLDITGSIQGNSSAAEIFADGAKISGEVKSMGSIKIGQSTTIIGNVYATSAVVAGAVKGDIDVKGPVILDSTAIVLGNIKSKAVQINNGAVIEGVVSQCYAEVNPKSFFEELKKMK